MSQEEGVQLAPLPLARPLPMTRPRRRTPSVGIAWGEIWSDLTWDLRALVIGIVVVFVAGMAWLVVPRKEAPIVPVLGIVAPAPTPPPKPTPKPQAKSKRRWLPW